MVVISDKIIEEKVELKEEFTVKTKKPKLSEDEMVSHEIDLIRNRKLGLKKNRIFFEKLMKKHIAGDRDYIICASGFEGEGKSRMVNQLGTELARCKTEEQKLHFLKSNVIYDPTGGELIKVLKNIKSKSILLVDEAQKLLYKRNYNTSERKNLNILFSTIREKNLIVIFCIPDFYDLDVYFRNWRVKTWIYIPIRGLAVVFKKSNSPFSKDKWEQKKNQKIIEHFEDIKNDGRLLGKTDIIYALRKLKSYGFEFGFDDWDSKAVKDMYHKYKDWGRTVPPEENDEEEKTEYEKNVKIAQELFLKGSTTQEISDLLGKSISSIRDYVRPVRNKKDVEEVKDEYNESDVVELTL